MSLSQTLIRGLVARANLISERLTGKVIADETRQSDHTIQLRLEAWCQTAAKGDWQQFERRLAYDGLDIDTVRRVLGGVRLADSQPWPAWAYTVQEALQAAETMTLAYLAQGIPAPDRSIDPAEPLPFEDVLLPFIQVARQHLKARPGVNYSQLPEPCQVALERSLLRRLSYTGGRAFLSAFSVFRTLAQTSAAPSQAEDPGREHYLAFVRDLLQGGLSQFFEEYGVLARLLATQTNFWVEATAEFLQRLRSDWPAIQSIFQATSEDPFSEAQIRSITPALSDPHDRGRFVIALEFVSGVQLVYKPKDIGLEATYHTLVAWLNAQGLSPTLKPLKSLNCTTHGWVEFAAHLPCQNQTQARQFYQRAGMLAALLYALRGADYHCQNIIASGAHPIPVDHEMLMYPYLQPAQTEPFDTVRELAYQQLNRSVLNTMLLAMWHIGASGQAYDISAWGVTNQEVQTVRLLRWQHINTDRMARAWQSVTVKTAEMPNVPTLEGNPLPLNDYLGDLLNGFRQMYHFLLDNRAALLASQGPLEAFKGQTVRFAFRETTFYRYFLETALAPKYLRDGADLSIRFDLLGRAWLLSERRLWPVLHAEQAALAQMDIPLFGTQTDSLALRVSSEVEDPRSEGRGSDRTDRVDKVLENCFSKTGYQLALSQLAGLSEADLTEQLGLIQAAVTGRKSGEVPLTAPDRLHGPDALDLNAVAPLTPEQMVQRAVEIAQVLGKRAIRTSQGATWIHLANDFQRGYYHLQPLGYGLYSGVSGVALFLAALYKITADAQYSQLALAALQPLQQMLHAQAGSSVFKHIGGVSELGSVIYTLVRIGQFLNEPTLWDAKHAHRAASFLTSDRIMEDRALDVIAGTAGAILGLLALYEVDPRTSVLEQALLCAQHLLASRVTSEVEYRAWPTMNGEPLTGFSHGAAGIAYALLRLYQVSGETALRDTAQEAIAYERSLFDVKAGNWPDLRFSTVEEPSCLTNWCHGAPGIGLARLGGLPVLDTDEIRADIAIALETTRRYGPQGVDHLCCGILGRAEFLLAASLRMSRPDLLELAKNWASWVVNRAERVGGYALGQNPQLAWAYSPGFFQGTAGIGYELLRLAHPNQLPSILLWD